MNSAFLTRFKAAWPRLKQFLRLVILACVLWGIYKTIVDAQAKFAAHEFSLGELHWRWIVASGALYILAALPAAWFWREAMLAMGQRPRFWEALRAYYVGNLGKYVPGKALVVVLRAGLVSSSRVATGVAALAVFVETLTLMAVGSVVAALILLILHRDQLFLTLIAVGLGLCAGIPTAPPLFRKIVRVLRVAKASPQVTEAVHGLKLGLMARGWVAMTISWICMGLSLWATLKAMPETQADLNDLGTILPLLIASIALATVAGFMSLIPGGFLVRELVVTMLLKPVVGEVAAIVSAVVLRLVSLLSELVVLSILYVVVRPPTDEQP
ncbi:MAG TPA: lysylphosphatidylglycerol synthase domain-containing protein [Pirellulaceae bacterium]|nr:lysylphosphatidylglycerol synthase domain-containing protein [Pirellulaceae bacterium]